MSHITPGAFYAMPFQPIKRALSRAIVAYKLRNLDRHIASMQIGIKNDLRAVGELQKDRALLARRLL